MSKLFDSRNFYGWHSPSGYANLGFRQITVRPKYSDRHLYSPRQVIERVQGLVECQLIQSFGLQKAGNQICECEDVWGYAQRDRHTAIALADGATESSFAKEWAGELVRHWVQQPESPLAESLLRSQKSWQQWLGVQDLSWFAKRKAAQGAFATFLSLRVQADRSWQAQAVGDSCLFLVRDHRLCRSFPLRHSHEFNYHPPLLGSDRVFTRQISQAQGEAKLGDRFYLATDAIACWILRQIETNQNPWLKLEQIQTQEQFANWVKERRDRVEIANDDTTLLCLEVLPSSDSLDSNDAP